LRFQTVRSSRRCSAAPSSTSTRPASRSRTRTARGGASRREPFVWAAGVSASGLAGQLAEFTGAEEGGASDGRGRSHPARASRGLRARRHGPRPRPRRHSDHVPRRRPGRHPAGPLRREGRPRSPEGPRRAAVPLPRTRGNLATVGRTAAVADIKGIKLSGFLASTTWVLVHLFYLMGFQNRLLVLIRWSISFATRGRGVRLITSPANADAAGRPAAHPEPLMPRTEVSQVR
jgi:NADH:ubiquinone reductase (H+-translocating)